MRFNFTDTDALIAYLLVLNIDDLTTHERYFFRHYTYIIHDMPRTGTILCYSAAYPPPFSIAFTVEDNGARSSCDANHLITAISDLRRRAQEGSGPTIETQPSEEAPSGQYDYDDYSSSEEAEYSSSEESEISSEDETYHANNVRVQELDSEGNVTERWIPQPQRIVTGWRNRVADYFETDETNPTPEEILDDSPSPEEIEVFIHPVMNSTEES